MDVKEHKRKFDDQGFTILRGFFSPAEMAELIVEIESAETKRSEASGLNKGEMTFFSNVFFKSAKLQEFVSQPRIIDLLTEVIGPDIWVRWDQAVAKGPGAPEFPWHQDNGYSRLKDQHFQLWVALTRMTADNGGLWLQPGSHVRALPHRVVGNHVAYDGTPESPIFIEAEAGDVVLFSSFMLHSTTPNVSREHRWAYVIEYMSLRHIDPYVDPPYYVVARRGERTSEFVQWYRGQFNPINQAKYLIPRTRAAVWSALRAGARTLRASVLKRART